MSVFFFFNDTATTEIYTLSLHDALPISIPAGPSQPARDRDGCRTPALGFPDVLDTIDATGVRQWCTLGLERLRAHQRSEEHTSELQSRQYLVCRLLLEKKKTLALVYLSS